MLRLSLALLGAAGVVLAFAEPARPRAAVGESAAAAPRLLNSSSTVVDPGCKPTAAIELTLRVPEGARAGRIPLEFDITPLTEMSELRWELVTPDRVFAEGERAGELLAERGVMRQAEALVDLPFDGRGYAVGVRVSGVVEGSNASGETFPERVSVEQYAVFGELVGDATPVQTRDAETGALTTVLAVPTRHKAGR